MPSDLTGLSSVDRAVPPAAGSVGRGEVAPSFALTRIAPTDPGTATRPVTAPTGTPVGSPLGRSGLDLLDLLATTDLVAQRPTTGAVAMEVGLEQARTALLRNLPGEALASLDGVWDRARRTEEGWYLRSGALTVLGLPGESERVADAGLAAHPASIALRFVQSLARFAIGDAVGARAALQPAMSRASQQPVLLVQSALIDAQQGDVPRARSTFDRLEKLWPDHPAVNWGRAALRTLVADRTRLQATPTAGQAVVTTSPTSTPPTPSRGVASRTTPSDWPATDGATMDSMPFESTPVERTATAQTSLDVDAAGPPSVARDVAADALERLGSRITLGSPNDVARDARMLLRAFSAGGTLAAATSPEQAHAARVVLTAFLAVATQELAESPAPVRTLVAQVIPLLQQRRADDAERVVMRQRALAREPIGRLLLAVVRGGLSAVATAEGRATDGASAVRAPRTTPVGGHDIFGATPSVQGLARGDAEKGPIVPVRIGLALIDESPAQRAAMDGRAMPDRGVTPWSATSLPLAFTDERGQPLSLSPDGRPPVDAETSLAGWGAARAAAEAAGGSPWTGGTSVRVAAVICVALAAAAIATGHGAVAIGLGIGAAWLGLRRSGNDRSGHTESGQTAPHDGGRSQ